MDGNNSWFAYQEQDAAEVPSQPCCHHFECVTPQQVQYEPQYNDLHAAKQSIAYSGPVSQHSGIVDHEGVAINVSLTYTTGDRTHLGHTAQDAEREWALLQLVQNFNHGFPEVLANGQALNSRQTAYYRQVQQEAAAMQFAPEDVATYVEPTPTCNAATPMPVDPLLPDYGAAPEIEINPQSTTSLGVPIYDSVSNRLTCDECGSTKCKSLVSLKRHKDREHGSNIKLYGCTHDSSCPYQSKKKTDVQRHVDTKHLKKRDYSCSLCNNSFSRKDNLKRHLKSKEHCANLANAL